jgi:hemerythrin-like metal-binding protein
LVTLQPISSLPLVFGGGNEMAPPIWNTKFSVGVRSLDDQHSVLFEALNAPHSAIMKGRARAVIGQLLHDLVAYIRDHFRAEEATLSLTKYPALAQHLTKHHDLTEQIKGYVERFDRGEIALSFHLLNFLGGWLTNHIQMEDHQYTLWLNNHGVS